MHLKSRPNIGQLKESRADKPFVASESARDLGLRRRSTAQGQGTDYKLNSSPCDRPDSSPRRYSTLEFVKGVSSDVNQQSGGFPSTQITAHGRR